MKKGRIAAVMAMSLAAFAASAQEPCATEECRSEAAQVTARLAAAVDPSPECDDVCELRKAQDAAKAGVTAFLTGMDQTHLASLLRTQALLRYSCGLGALSDALDALIAQQTHTLLEQQLSEVDRYASNHDARKWAIAEQTLQGLTFGYSIGFGDANTARLKAAGTQAQQEHEKNTTCAAVTFHANNLLEQGSP